MNLKDTLVRSGDTLVIDGSGIKGTHNLKLDASNETDSNLKIVGSAGTGNDTISMGTGLTSADTIQGGSGTADELHYTDDGKSTDELDNVTGIESIVLGDADTSIKTVDDLVASTKTLHVNANALSSSHSLTFDGSAETDGKFDVTGGKGADNITVGLGNDTVNAGNGDDTIIAKLGGTDSIVAGIGNDTIGMGTGLDVKDTIDGGAGTDVLYFTDSNNATNDLDKVINIEKIILGDATTSVTVAVNNGTAGQQLITSGSTLTVDGSALTSTHTLTWNGSNLNEKYSIIGGSGSDNITGATKADTISGGLGDDTINGGSGADSLVGGSGADSITGGTGADTISGGSGADTITDTLVANYSDSIDAGSGNDSIVLAAAVTLDTGDVIDGGDASDTDTLDLGNSHNLIDAADANIQDIDVISLGTGGETLNLSHQTEGFTITGGNGGDNITSGKGADSITGATGNDNITAGSGNDTIAGGAGDDVINGGAGADSIDGGAGTDSITGGSGADTILGGAGNDTITDTFASGTDSIVAGSGNDSIVLADDTTLGSSDVIDGGTGNDKLSLGTHNLTDAANDNIQGIESIALGTGGVSVNLSHQSEGFDITGGTGADTIVAGSGADTITGDSGADSITAGDGADEITGGAGNDKIYLGSNDGDSDTVNLTDNMDTDTIYNFTVGSSGDVIDGESLDSNGYDFDGTLANVTADVTDVTDNEVYVYNYSGNIASKDFGDSDFGEIFVSDTSASGNQIDTDTNVADEQFLLVVQGDDQTQIYFVDPGADSTNTNISATDVTLIAVLADVDNSDTFVAANFT